MMYIGVTIYTKYIVLNLVRPGAAASTECSVLSLFLLPFLFIYFDTIPLSVSHQLFP